MSYDIDLIDTSTNEVIKMSKPVLLTGGTYCPDGVNKLSCNITYNYGEVFRKFLGEKGIRSIYGKTAKETLSVLIEMADNLKDDISDDYWDSTEGNVKEAVLTLIKMALLAPHGIWQGD